MDLDPGFFDLESSSLSLWPQSTHYVDLLGCFFFVADFFDSGVVPSRSDNPSTSSKSEEKDKQEQQPAEAMADKLPEGFFDDAKMDAKVRFTIILS